jgi:predicted lipid-binding transport protein (Tim44 family)
MRLAGIFAALLMVFSIVAIGQAEARMGGSFGSRGMRTFQSVPSTVTSPRMGSPIQRSMTPNTGGPSMAAPASQFGNQRPGFFGGFGGSLLGGMLFGGMLGMMFGHGFGGVAGGFGFLFQLLIIGGILWFVFRRRSPTAPGVASGDRSFGFPGFGTTSNSNYNNQPSGPANRDEIGVSNADLAKFEAILHDMQDAFAREDYAGLRRLTTPEMVSYLSEELSQNATQGVKNEVSDLKFLQGDVAESWREGNRDYASVAMRYSAIDVLRDRTTGKIVKGDAETPSETTEIWTFVREGGRDWQLSAIQEA